MTDLAEDADDAAIAAPVRELASNEHGPGQLSPRQIWLIVIGLMIGGFLSSLDVLVVITALPTIVGDLGGRSQLSWVLASYLLTSTVSGPLFGKLSDLIGRRRLYQLSVLIFVFGSVVAALAPGIGVLIAGRAIQGIGAGGLMTLPFAIVADVTGPRDRARYTSVMTINFTAASVLGPLVGGILVDHASWRWIFWINIPLGIIALFAAIRMKLPVHPKQPVVVDYIGMLLLVAAASTLLLVFTFGGNTYDWGSPQIAGLVVLAAVLIVALVWWERRAKEPTLPPRIFATTRFKLLTASVTMQAVAMYAAWALMPIFLQVVTGTSATNTGLLLLPFVLGNTVASVITGRLVARTGHIKWAPVLGQVISGVAFFLYITMGTGTSLATASVYMGIAGFGIGMTLQTAMIMGQAVVDRRDLGAATAAIAFFRNLGQAAGAAIGLGVLNSQLNHNLDHALSDDVRRNLPADALQGSPQAIRELAPDVRHAVVNSFADALHTAFIVTFPTAVVGLVLFIFVKRMRLGDRHIIEPGPPEL